MSGRRQLIRRELVHEVKAKRKDGIQGPPDTYKVAASSVSQHSFMTMEPPIHLLVWKHRCDERLGFPTFELGRLSRDFSLLAGRLQRLFEMPLSIN
jgi:hypothetical protein